MMTLAIKIVQQTQPTALSCVATCIAMALGVDVSEMDVPLDNALDVYAFGVWLAERGVWMRRAIWIDGHGEQYLPNTVYLVGVPSLNLVGSTHCVVLDTRSDDNSIGSRIYDPNFGREGLKTYADNRLVTLDFVELVDRNSKYVCIGKPPCNTGSSHGP